jgi:hypothetical protein
VPTGQPSAEEYLLHIESEMKSTVSNLTEKALETFPLLPLDEWILEFPYQVIFTSTLMILTHEVDKILSERQAAQPTNINESQLDNSSKNVHISTLCKVDSHEPLSPSTESIHFKSPFVKSPQNLVEKEPSVTIESNDEVNVLELLGRSFDEALLGNNKVMVILQEKSLKGLYMRLLFWINQICKLMKLSKENKEVLNNISLINLQQFTCFLIYMKDVIHQLHSSNISSVESYDWCKVPRINWESDSKKCLVECGGMTIPQQLEYLGPQPDLLLSPITEKQFVFISSTLREKSACIINSGVYDECAVEVYKKFAQICAIPLREFNCVCTVMIDQLLHFLNGSAFGKIWLLLDNMGSIPYELLRVFNKELQMIQQQFIIAEISSTNNEKDSSSQLDKVDRGIFGIYSRIEPCDIREPLKSDLKASFRITCITSIELSPIISPNLKSIAFKNYVELSLKFNEFLKSYSMKFNKHISARDFKKIIQWCQEHIFMQGEQSYEQEIHLLGDAIYQVLYCSIDDKNYENFVKLVQLNFGYIASDEHAYSNDVFIEAAQILSIAYREDFMKLSAQCLHYLNTSRHILIYGKPLVGKSTFIEYLLLLDYKISKISTIKEKIAINAIGSDHIYSGKKPGIIETVIRQYEAMQLPLSRPGLIVDGVSPDIYYDMIASVIQRENQLLPNGTHLNVPLSFLLIGEFDNLEKINPHTATNAHLCLIKENSKPEIIFASAARAIKHSKHYSTDYITSAFQLIGSIINESKVQEINTSIILQLFQSQIGAFDKCIDDILKEMADHKQRSDTIPKYVTTHTFSSIAILAMAYSHPSVIERTNTILNYCTANKILSAKLGNYYYSFEHQQLALLNTHPILSTKQLLYITNSAFIVATDAFTKTMYLSNILLDQGYSPIIDGAQATGKSVSLSILFKTRANKGNNYWLPNYSLYKDFVKIIESNYEIKKDKYSSLNWTPSTFWVDDMELCSLYSNWLIQKMI